MILSCWAGLAAEVMNKVLGVGVSDWECGVRVHECYGGANFKCQ